MDCGVQYIALKLTPSKHQMKVDVLVCERTVSLMESVAHDNNKIVLL